MKRLVVLVVAAAFVCLALSGVALAATPQSIYDDYAADHDLDGTYTTADLQAYLGDSFLHQYGNQAIVAALDAVVAGILSAPGHQEFPFTGAQSALVALVAVGLVGTGVGIRAVSRSRT